MSHCTTLLLWLLLLPWGLVWKVSAFGGKPHGCNGETGWPAQEISAGPAEVLGRRGHKRASAQNMAAYQSHGLRDLLRDLVVDKTTRGELLKAAGVSEFDGRRRIPWNSTSLKHLVPCWSLLLKLGHILPEVARHVDAAKGKVHLTQRVGPLDCARLLQGAWRLWLWPAGP